MKETMKILCVEGNHRGIVIPVPIDADFIEASAFCKKFRQTSFEDGEWVDGYEFSQYAIFTDLWTGLNSKNNSYGFSKSRQIQGICYTPRCDMDDLLYRIVDFSMEETPVHCSGWKHDHSYLRVLSEASEYVAPTIDIERATAKDIANLKDQREWYKEYIYE